MNNNSERLTLLDHRRQIQPPTRSEESPVNPQTATVRELIGKGLAILSRGTGFDGLFFTLSDGTSRRLSS